MTAVLVLLVLLSYPVSYREEAACLLVSYRASSKTREPWKQRDQKPKRKKDRKKPYLGLAQNVSGEMSPNADEGDRDGVAGPGDAGRHAVSHRAFTGSTSSSTPAGELSANRSGKFSR